MKMAADRGNPYAMHLYGVMLYNGDCVNKNKKEAAFYFKKAAAVGSSESIYLYARMLSHGDGIEMNVEEANKYFSILRYNQKMKDF